MIAHPAPEAEACWSKVRTYSEKLSEAADTLSPYALRQLASSWSPATLDRAIATLSGAVVGAEELVETLEALKQRRAERGTVPRRRA